MVHQFFHAAFSAGEDESVLQVYHARGDGGKYILRMLRQCLWLGVQNHGHMIQHLLPASIASLRTGVTDSGDQISPGVYAT